MEGVELTYNNDHKQREIFACYQMIILLLAISTTCYNAYLSSYRVSKYFHLEEQRRKASIFTAATSTIQLKTTTAMVINPITG